LMSVARSASIINCTLPWAANMPILTAPPLPLLTGRFTILRLISYPPFF
jgi:hypothetical protein